MPKTNYQIQNNVEQKTEDWFAMREGMVTGSVAKQVRTKGDAYMYEVLATMTTNVKPKSLDSIEAIKWGNEQEPFAREAYMKETGFDVVEIGFITNGRYGLSPDGAVLGKMRNIAHTVEIKCPDSKTHIKYCLTGGIPKEYKPQIVHNFIVIDDLERLDFVSFDPRVKQRPMYIYTVTRDALGAEIEVAKMEYERHMKSLDANYKKLIL